MDSLASVSSAGLFSLSGYAFQIKVFIWMMAQLSDGQRVEFETIDDVAVSEIKSNNNLADSCIKTHVMTGGKIKAFQVKQTKVSDSVARQVLYNWLLAFHLHPEIEEFKLILDQGYPFNSKVFQHSAAKEFNELLKANKGENALVTRVKRTYDGDFGEFEKAFKHICAHMYVISLSEIDKDIAGKLCSPFHSSMADAINPHFNMRINELIVQVCARIMLCAGKRIPYVCTYGEYMQLCEEICRNISEEQYIPDYDSFKIVHMSGEIGTEVIESREYRQLKFCRITEANRIEHLRWEEYYKNIRQHLLIDAKKSKINKTEDIAFQNYTDVVNELQDGNEDTPTKRLVQTKKQSISTLSDEYSRWGAYIYLTRDGAEQQIAWKDEEATIDG